MNKQRDHNPPTRHARKQGPTTGGQSAATSAGAPVPRRLPPSADPPVPRPAGLTNGRRDRRGHFDDREPTFTPALAQAAKDLADARLIDAELSPAAIAAQLHVPLRTLQRAFSSLNESSATAAGVQHVVYSSVGCVESQNRLYVEQGWGPSTHGRKPPDEITSRRGLLGPGGGLLAQLLQSHHHQVFGGALPGRVRCLRRCGDGVRAVRIVLEPAPPLLGRVRPASPRLRPPPSDPLAELWTRSAGVIPDRESPPFAGSSAPVILTRPRTSSLAHADLMWSGCYETSEGRRATGRTD